MYGAARHYNHRPRGQESPIWAHYQGLENHLCDKLKLAVPQTLTQIEQGSFGENAPPSQVIRGWRRQVVMDDDRRITLHRHTNHY